MKLLILVLVAEMYIYETLACFFLSKHAETEIGWKEKSTPHGYMGYIAVAQQTQ